MSLPVWLADPALQPVWRRLRAPLERGSRTARVTGMSPATRHALAAALGRPVTGDVRVVLSELDGVLGERAGLHLRDVVEVLTGPLRDRAAEASAREAPLAVLASRDLAWADGVRASGVLARVADPLALVEQAVRVLAVLPVQARLRTELAASVLGDAHALDDGPLASVVLRGLSAGAMPSDRRGAWEAAGVLADTVSTTVLTLGLTFDGVAGDEPRHLTPWDLRRHEVTAPGPVLVVENPAVLEAFAVAHGGRFPLVCTAGWPATVAVDLVQRLGGPLSYHGDLDWRGVEICGWLVDRCSVLPWRMTVDDYLAAPGGELLTGRQVETPWEPGLAEAMRSRGVAVHEEQLLPELLMARPGPGRW